MTADPVPIGTATTRKTSPHIGWRPPTMPRPGTAFHRLAERVSWRRTLIAVVAVFLLTRAVKEYLPMPMDDLHLPVLGPATGFAAALAAAALCVPLVLVLIRVVEGRPAGTLSSVAGRIRYRWLAWCLLPAVLCQLVYLGIYYGPSTLVAALVVPWTAPSPRTAMASAVLLLPLIVLQCASEEYISRGVALQAFRVGRSMWWPVIAQAVGWTLLHGIGSPLTGPGVADLMIWGLALGWISVRTGGIEAAIAYHAVGNVIVLLIVLKIDGQQGLADTGSAGSASDWTLPIAALTAGAIYAVSVAVLAASRRLPTTTPAVEQSSRSPRQPVQ